MSHDPKCCGQCGPRDVTPEEDSLLRSAMKRASTHVASGRLAAPVQAEPVATLHDDGCFTWKRDEFRLRFDRQRAGWRMDVYAAPAAQPQPQPQPVNARYVADLEDTLNQIADALGVKRGQPEALIAAAKAAQPVNAQMRDALRPFAAMAPHYPKAGGFATRPKSGTMYSVESGGIGYAEITVEALHEAAAALAAADAAQPVALTFDDAWPQIEAKLPSHYRTAYKAADVEAHEKQAARAAWDLAHGIQAAKGGGRG